MPSPSFTTSDFSSNKLAAANQLIPVNLSAGSNRYVVMVVAFARSSAVTDITFMNSPALDGVSMSTITSTHTDAVSTSNAHRNIYAFGGAVADGGVSLSTISFTKSFGTTFDNYIGTVFVFESINTTTPWSGATQKATNNVPAPGGVSTWTQIVNNSSTGTNIVVNSVVCWDDQADATFALSAGGTVIGAPLLNDTNTGSEYDINFNSATNSVDTSSRFTWLSDQTLARVTGIGFEMVYGAGAAPEPPASGGGDSWTNPAIGTSWSRNPWVRSSVR